MGLFDMFGRSRTPPRERVEPTITPAASLENPSVPLSGAEGTWLHDWAALGIGQGFGPAINERTAMAVSAVYRSVTLISGLVANLPLKIYERTPEGRREATEHRLNRLLKLEPLPGTPMTAHQFKETLVVCLLLHGNAYAVIRYDQAARVIGFELAMPWTVQILRTRAGRHVYRVDWPDREVEYVDFEDMLHIAGPGFDGVSGMSRIQFNARDAVALSKVLEEQTGRAHENAARPSGMVTVPRNITAKGLERFTAQFSGDYAGRANVGRVFFADEGSAFTPLQLTPVDLATIESRRYQVADISRFFGVPLPLLNETDKSTSWGSGLTEQNRAFLVFTLDADLSRIENVLNARLLGDGRFYAEFERDALLAMDPLKTAQVAQTEVSFGGLTPNEYRRLKNRPPIEGGDKPLVNSTKVPLERALNPPDPAEPGDPTNA